MHSRRTGFSLEWVLCLALLSGSIGAAPPAAAPKVAPQKAPPPAARKPAPGTPKRPPETGGTPASAKAPSTPAVPDPVAFADAWPSEVRPTAPDLEVKDADARKAEALTAFALGLLAEENSDQEAMLRHYRRALELDPGYTELAVKVAFELVKQRDPSGALQILKDAIKATPGDPLPYIYASQIYTELKKPDLALSYAEKALEIAPNNFKSYVAVYEIHERSGQKAKADAVLARAAKADTKDTQFWVDLGELLQKLYLKEDGTAAPEDQKRMNAVYQRLSDFNSTDPGVLVRIADYYARSRQVKEAIPRYLAILSLPPKDDDVRLENVREKLARSLLAIGQPDEAINVLELMLKQAPERFDTYELLGELYEQKGDIERAMQNYEHSLKLDTTEPRNHLRFADFLRQQKMYERAVETLQKAREKFPDLPYVTYGLALTLSRARQHDEALASFAEAEADAQKRNEEMLNADFYFNYGAAAEQAGKMERAAELLKQCIELEPNAAQAYNYLGYMWVDRGERLEEAGALIKKALELDPDNGAYLDSFGWYLFKRGDYEKALRELLRAQENILREEKRDDAVVLEHIADTYSKLGKTPEALTFWQKALALEQEDKALITRITEKIDASKQKVTSGAPMPEPAKKQPSPASEQQQQQQQ